MLYRLHHPNLPRMYDFFEEDGAHFLVMDYVDGHTLEEELRVNGPMPEEDVRHVARNLLDVFGYMHTQQPPGSSSGISSQPTSCGTTAASSSLIDFGIAKVFEDAQIKTHTIIRSAGTPGFAAPEQYGAGTDARSDIYSLGATLYNLLTAQVPPPSPALAVDAAHLIPLEDLRPDCSVQMLMAVRTMMQTSPTRRPKPAGRSKQHAVRHAHRVADAGPTSFRRRPVPNRPPSTAPPSP